MVIIFVLQITHLKNKFMHTVILISALLVVIIAFISIGIKGWNNEQNGGNGCF